MRGKVLIDYSFDKIEFAVFCVENVALKLGMDSILVYEKLKTSGILDNYIMSSYEVLHTQGKEYIVDDIIDLMSIKGVA